MKYAPLPKPVALLMLVCIALDPCAARAPDLEPAVFDSQSLSGVALFFGHPSLARRVTGQDSRWIVTAGVAAGFL